MTESRNDTTNRIAAYLDLHGWDRVRDPEFHRWLREQGVDVDTLSIWPQEKQLSLKLYGEEPLG